MLTQHSGFCFDTAYAPAQDAKALIMVVCESVPTRLSETLPRRDDLFLGRLPCEKLQIDLVYDPACSAAQLGSCQRLVAPTQELVTLFVPFKLDFNVFESASGSKIIHLNRVIDDQVDGNQWIDFLGVSTQCFHSIPHCCEVDDRWYPGKILQHNTCWLKRYF